MKEAHYKIWKVLPKWNYPLVEGNFEFLTYFCEETEGQITVVDLSNQKVSETQIFDFYEDARFTINDSGEVSIFGINEDKTRVLLLHFFASIPLSGIYENTMLAEGQALWQGEQLMLVNNILIGSDVITVEITQYEENSVDSIIGSFEGEFTSDGIPAYIEGTFQAIRQ